MPEGAKEYRKKPVVVRAIRMESVFKVKTLEGTMIGLSGDWLVEGTQGELYPVKNDIFLETYEEVK